MPLLATLDAPPVLVGYCLGGTLALAAACACPVAGPGSSQFFGAMENWGAIFYFEPELLFDPKRATESGRQRIFTVVAHEMAHQWFGDLVTMALSRSATAG